MDAIAKRPVSARARFFDGLPEPLGAALVKDSSPLAITCQGFITTTEEFLRAAQLDGGDQPWVRGSNLFLSTLAAAWMCGASMADESSREALQTLMRLGWETPASRPQDCRLRHRQAMRGSA
ncbi:hypothetical protein ABZX74_28970 [Streptomyces olivaceoviridis]|uniref:hypothetical protein n=1 Tax=Streptomyces olivaceoviridis TaxID=1921 RepID=UPI0033A39812